MERPVPVQPSETAKVAQLEQLNERSRWYSSRLWQEPLGFFGIVVLVLSTTRPAFGLEQGVILILLSILGGVLYWSMRSMKRAEGAAVLALIRLEKKLHLESTAKVGRGISPMLQFLVLIVVVVLFLGGVYGLIMWQARNHSQPTVTTRLSPNTTLHSSVTRLTADQEDCHEE